MQLVFLRAEIPLQPNSPTIILFNPFRGCFPLCQAAVKWLLKDLDLCCIYSIWFSECCKTCNQIETISGFEQQGVSHSPLEKKQQQAESNIKRTL